MIKKTWSFGEVWNESLLEKEERPLLPRSHLWASELGKAPIDIILKMRGEPPTNPPNARSLRKFEAGNIWEWVVKLILLRAGILREAQQWTRFQYPKCVEVTGKLDFIAGGQPDYGKARAELASLNLPDIFTRAGKNILAHFERNHPEGLADKILEIKSCSAFMYEHYERHTTAGLNHRLQLMHYLKGTEQPQGAIVYISRDDCRMLEIGVFQPSFTEEEYHREIENLTRWYHADTLPPKEQPIVYDEDFKKFSKNWRVAYSAYLTKLYDYKDQAAFDEVYAPITERWNRVLGRMREGKPMTDKNKSALEEMKHAGFDLDKITEEKNGNTVPET